MTKPRIGAVQGKDGRGNPVVAYPCPICGAAYRDPAVAERCLERGVGTPPPVGTIFNDPRGGWGDITFAVARTEIHGHTARTWLLAARDNTCGDSIKAKDWVPGPTSLEALALYGAPDPTHPTFLRVTAELERLQLDARVYDERGKLVTLERYLTLAAGREEDPDQPTHHNAMIALSVARRPRRAVEREAERKRMAAAQEAKPAKASAPRKPGPSSAKASGRHVPHTRRKGRT